MLLPSVTPPRDPSQLPAFLLARADIGLPSSVHHALARCPSEEVRTAWAIRGDIPVSVAEQYRQTEQHLPAWLGLATLPGTSLPSSSPAVDGAWLQAAHCLHPGQDETTATALANQLRGTVRDGDEWLAVFGLLTAPLRDTARYPALLAVALHGPAGYAAVAGAPPRSETMSALETAGRANPTHWALPAAVGYDADSAAAACDTLHFADDTPGERRDAVVAVLRDPVRVARESSARTPLPLLMALRLTAATRKDGTVHALLDLAQHQKQVRQLLAQPLLANPNVPEDARCALLDPAGGSLPPACPPRGPRPEPFGSPDETLNLSRMTFSALHPHSVGAGLLDTAERPAEWEVVVALWAEWHGSVRQLLTTAAALA